jgi:hypothetical protein
VQQQRQQQQQQQSQPQQQLQRQQHQHNQNQKSTILSNNMATSNSDDQSTLTQSVQTESSPAVENGQLVPPPRPAYVSPPPYIDNADSPHSAQIRPNQAPNETSPSSTSQVEPQEIIIDTSSLLPQEQEMSFDQNGANVKQDFSADQLNSPSLQSSPQMTSFQDENSQPGLSATEGGSSQQVTSVEQNGFSEKQGLLTETIQDAPSQQQQGFMTEPIENGSSLQTEQGISDLVVDVQQNTPTQFIDPQNEQSDVAIPNNDNLSLSSMRKK